MTIMLLQLSLFVVTVIQLTSSRSTHDVTQQDNDVSRCGRTEQVLNQLLIAVSQLQQKCDACSGNKDGSDKPRTKECPNSFTYVAAVNGCYKVINRNWNWDSAGIECRSLHEDAHLLVINNAQEQHEIVKMLDSTNETTLADCTRENIWGTYYWTAGQRIDPNSNSTFVWRVNTDSDTVTVMKYTNWHSGEPNYNNQLESCVNLFGGRSYTWNDASCGATLCSVCEIDMST